jgi:hypothetical protein
MEIKKNKRVDMPFISSEFNENAKIEIMTNQATGLIKKGQKR